MSRLPCLASIAICTALLASTAHAADVVRHPLLGGSKFPIARAVEVPARRDHSLSQRHHARARRSQSNLQAQLPIGATPRLEAPSTFAKIKESLDQLGLGFGDVVAMTVYLVGDPAKGGRMDFDGFMAAYSQYFGTAEQPNLPARSTVQVAGLVQPGMLVEVEVQLVKRGK